MPIRTCVAFSETLGNLFQCNSVWDEKNKQKKTWCTICKISAILSSPSVLNLFLQVYEHVFLFMHDFFYFHHWSCFSQFQNIPFTPLFTFPVFFSDIHVLCLSTLLYHILVFVIALFPTKFIPLWVIQHNIDGLIILVQDCNISSALAMEILQSCTKPPICAYLIYICGLRYRCYAFKNWEEKCCFWTKWLSTSSNAFSWKKYLYFDSYITVVCFRGSNWPYVSIVA